MGERTVRPTEMATTSTAVAVAPQVQEESEHIAVITLRPTRTSQRKKVVWTEDTIDNEEMNKKKSKCCCIYTKPHKWDESDSEDSDEECEHCFGHVERRHRHAHAHPSTSTQQVQEAPQEHTEPTTVVTLHVKTSDPETAETASEPAITPASEPAITPTPEPAMAPVPAPPPDHHHKHAPGRNKHKS